MSAAYIYGGIDRAGVPWALEGRTEGGLDSRDDDTTSAGPGRVSGAAYVYGGLDRTRLDWPNQVPPTKNS